MSATLIWRGLLLLLVLAPVPLASNRPAAWSALAFGTGLLLLGWCAVAVRGDRPLVWRATLWPPVLCLAVAAAWALVQALLPVATADATPLWQLAEEVLGTPVAARPGVAPNVTLEALMLWLTYAAAFWLALQFGRDAGRAWTAVHWFTVASAIYAAYGLVNYMAGNTLLLWYPRWAYFDDLTSTFVNRNNYATFAVFGMLAAITLMVRAYNSKYRLSDRSAARSTRVAEAFVGVPLLYALGTLIIAMAWLQTHSRLGFTAGVAGLLALLALMRGGVSVGGRLLGALGLLGGGAFLLAVSGGGTLTRLAETQGFDRVRLFEMVLRGIGDAPWTGHGLGSFAGLFPTYRDPGYAPGVEFDRAHSSYLELAFEIGIPAAALFVFALLWLALMCVRGAHVRRHDRALPALAAAAAVTGAVHSVADFPLNMPAVAYAFAVLLGIGVAQSWSHGRAGTVP